MLDSDWTIQILYTYMWTVTGPYRYYTHTCGYGRKYVQRYGFVKYVTGILKEANSKVKAVHITLNHEKGDVLPY